MIAALDIGGTKIAVGLVDAQGQIHAEQTLATAAYRDWPLARRAILAILEPWVRHAPAPLQGLGIACTGPIDPFRGRVGPVSFLPGWQDAPVAAELGAALELSVAMENDADAAALAEYAWGAGQGTMCFLYVTLSTGIGVGLLHHGQLYRGAAGAHPEFGHHVCAAGRGPRCYCGQRGCWESLAAGPALARWYREKVGGEPALTAAAIAQRARHGDRQARAAFARLAHFVSLGLANLLTAYGPDRVALGGGLMQSADLFFPRAQERARTLVTQVPVSAEAIVPARLGTQAALAGGAAAWCHRYRQAPFASPSP